MSEPLSQQEFRKLPVSVSLETFSRWTGLDRWTIMEMRRDGELRSIRIGRRRHRYPRSEIARIAGWKD